MLSQCDVIGADVPMLSQCDVIGAGVPMLSQCDVIGAGVPMLSQCDVIGAGMPMKIAIINDGLVSPYITEPGLSDQILIPPEVDTVNLTWQAGHETVSGSIVFFFFFVFSLLFVQPSQIAEYFVAYTAVLFL